MTEGAPWRHVLAFSVPLLLGALLQQLYHTADSIIVGRFAGESALSAVGTTGSFLFLFLAVAIGISSGNGVVVAQRFGAGDTEGMRANAACGMLLLGAAGLAATALAFAFARPAFEGLVAVPKSILPDTLLYFRVCAAGLAFQFGYNALAAILRAVGDSAATLWFLLLSSALNVVLDLLFVAGFGWGVAGAAAATDLSQAAAFAVACVYVRQRYRAFRFRRGDLRRCPALAGATVAVGLPITLQLVVVSFGLTFIQRAVNAFGAAMTASFTVGHRIEMYLNLPASAFQTTLATYTGQNLGAGRPERVARGLRQTMSLSLAMTLPVSALIWLGAPWMAALFGLSGEAADWCRLHLQAVALVNVVLSLYMPVFGVFQGAGRSAFPMAVATVALSTRVLATYLLRSPACLGESVIWWNGIFGFGLGFLMTWTYYLSGRWRPAAPPLPRP